MCHKSLLPSPSTECSPTSTQEKKEEKSGSSCPCEGLLYLKWWDNILKEEGRSNPMIVNYYDDFTHKDQFILHAQHYMETVRKWPWRSHGDDISTEPETSNIWACLTELKGAHFYLRARLNQWRAPLNVVLRNSSYFKKMRANNSGQHPFGRNWHFFLRHFPFLSSFITSADASLQRQATIDTTASKAINLTDQSELTFLMFTPSERISELSVFKPWQQVWRSAWGLIDFSRDTSRLGQT